MAKRLIKFRGTNDFARVNGRPRRAPQPHYTWNGKEWVLSDTGADDNIRGPLWRSCNPSPFEQNMIYTQYVNFIQVNNNNQGGATAGAYGLGVIGAALGGLPGLLVGTALGAGLGSFGSTVTSGGAYQTANGPRFFSGSKFKPPCPLKDPLSFEEPTFEEHLQNWAAILAGQVPSTPSNTTPMEAQ